MTVSRRKIRLPFHLGEGECSEHLILRSFWAGEALIETEFIGSKRGIVGLTRNELYPSFAAGQGDVRRERALLSWKAAMLHGLEDLLGEAEKIWRWLGFCEEDATVGKDVDAVELDAYSIGV